MNVQSDGSPHPVPPCPVSPQVASRYPRGLVSLCVVSCGLSFPFLTCQARNGNGNGKAQQHSTGTETETNLPCKERNGTAERWQQRERNGTYQRNGTERNAGTAGRTANGRTKPDTEGSPKRKGRHTPFSSLPSFQHSRFPSFPVTCARQLKLFFGLYAMFTHLFTKLGKINL